MTKVRANAHANERHSRRLCEYAQSRSLNAFRSNALREETVGMRDDRRDVDHGTRIRTTVVLAIRCRCIAGGRVAEMSGKERRPRPGDEMRER